MKRYDRIGTWLLKESNSRRTALQHTKPKTPTSLLTWEWWLCFALPPCDNPVHGFYHSWNMIVIALFELMLKYYKMSHLWENVWRFIGDPNGDFGRKLNLNDNFIVDYIHRFGLDTFVSFENEQRSVFLTPRKSNNNHRHEAWPFFIKIYFQIGEKSPAFRTHLYLTMLTRTCRWIHLQPDESSSHCRPRTKPERKYLFHCTVKVKCTIDLIYNFRA